MKIVDIQRFINKIKLLSESVTLSNIRQGILGKKGMKEYPVIDSDKEWYEEHKNDVLSSIEKVLNTDDKTLNNKMRKFDTDGYFTNDKPRKLKVRELLNDINKKFISLDVSMEKSDKSLLGLKNQFEVEKINDEVEIYSVFTPLANRQLSHKYLQENNSITPGWCIASSSAEKYWTDYGFYDSDYPCVFIIYKKGNPEKYQITCDTKKVDDFVEGRCSFDMIIDEVRNCLQTEEDIQDTSLFNNFKISFNDLKKAIEKLLTSRKSQSFSKNFGKEMLKEKTEKLKNSSDENEKRKCLTSICKNGLITKFYNFIPEEDYEYYVEQLIKFDILFEENLIYFDMRDYKKGLLNICKNERCTNESLEWSLKYFNDKNLSKQIILALREDSLNEETYKIVLKNNDSELKDLVMNRMFEFGTIPESFLKKLFDTKDEIKILSFINTTIRKKSMNGTLFKWIIDNKKFHLIKDAIYATQNIEFSNENYLNSIYSNFSIIKEHGIDILDCIKKIIFGLYQTDNLSWSIITSMILEITDESEIQDYTLDLLLKGYENYEIDKICKEVNWILKYLFSFGDEKCAISFTKLIVEHEIFNNESFYPFFDYENKKSAIFFNSDFRPFTKMISILIDKKELSEEGLACALNGFSLKNIEKIIMMVHEKLDLDLNSALSFFDDYNSDDAETNNKILLFVKKLLELNECGVDNLSILFKRNIGDNFINEIIENNIDKYTDYIYDVCEEYDRTDILNKYFN